MQYWPSKGATVVTDYGLNWAPTLSDLGDLTIADSDWEVQSGSATLSNYAFTDTSTAVRVSAGEPNEEQIFRNTVTLSDDSVYYEDVFLKILP